MENFDYSYFILTRIILIVINRVITTKIGRLMFKHV